MKKEFWMYVAVAGALLSVAAVGPIVRRLQDLIDVNLVSPADNHVLTYDSATGRWGAEAAPGAGSGDDIWVNDLDRVNPNFLDSSTVAFVGSGSNVVPSVVAGGISSTELAATIDGTAFTNMPYAHVDGALPWANGFVKGGHVVGTYWDITDADASSGGGAVAPWWVMKSYTDAVNFRGVEIDENSTSVASVKAKRTGGPYELLFSGSGTGMVNVAASLIVQSNLFLGAARSNIIDVIANAGGGGGGGANWTADGTTNSTLPGVASVYSLTVSNALTVDTVNSTTLNVTDPIAGTKISFSDPDANYASNTVEGAIAELDDVNGSGPNAGDGKVDWSQLVNVPAGFADGADNTDPGGAYSVISSSGTPLTQRTNANFDAAVFSIADDAGNNETDITLDADLVDLADGELTGGKVGAGISGDNITVGTIASERITNTIARTTGSTNTGNWDFSGATVTGLAGITYNITGALDTSDATSTPIATNAIATNTSFTAFARLIGGGSNHVAHTIRTAGYRNVDNAPTLFRSTFDSQIDRTNHTHAQLATNSWFALSGNNLVTYVKGMTNENMHWYVAEGSFQSTTNYYFAGGGASCSTARDAFTTASNGSTSVGSGSTSAYVATKFTAGASYDACNLSVWLQKVGAPTFNMTFGIWSHNSGSDQPNALIGTGGVIAATGVSTGAEAEYNVDITASGITSGTTYWVVVQCSATEDLSNYIMWHRASESLANSIRSSADAVTWSSTSSTRRNKFQIYSN